MGSIAAACASDPPEGVRYLQGDFVTWPFQPGSFDAVTALPCTISTWRPTGSRPSAEA